MYAQDRAKGTLSKTVFQVLSEAFHAPKWFEEAVEHQKIKYY
jgi:hypothetical protein